MLMALQDWDQPYVINILEDGDLVILGTYDYGNLSSYSFLPHPKKDPITGEMFFLGVSNKTPYVIYSHVSKNGSVSKGVPITTSGPTYMHDFGLTKNYVIFMDLPYCFNPEYMVKNEENEIHAHAKKRSRFGILPRYATSENGIVWFEFKHTMFIFHNGNSWEEEDDNIILISCVFEPEFPTQASTKTGMGKESTLKSGVSIGHPEAELESGDLVDCSFSSEMEALMLPFSPALLYGGPPVPIYHELIRTGPISRCKTPSDFASSNEMVHGTTMSEHVVDSNNEDKGKKKPNNKQKKPNNKNKGKKKKKPDLPTLYKFTFNMKTKTARWEQLSKTKADYPKINESYIGRRSRYVYTSEFTEILRNTSIVKTNLQWNTELKLDLAGMFGSEVVFVPSCTSPEEDSGYLTTFVHDEFLRVSYAYVIDAQQMQIISVVELPNRVPYGFHAIFLTEEELQSQRRTLT